VSVEYSLAPEYPFPAAIIDALSVVEFLLDGNPSRKIHIGGVSAGGYLALVAGFEAFRKYPGRISRYAGLHLNG
jgi:acetyl esterase/lipase